MTYMDRVKAMSTFEITLPSGLRAKGRYVDMEQMLISGQFDTGVLEELAKLSHESTNGDGPSREQVVEVLRYKQEVVTRCLLELDGEPVTNAGEVYEWLSQDDRNTFFRTADRQVAPLPEEE